MGKRLVTDVNNEQKVEMQRLCNEIGIKPYKLLKNALELVIKHYNDFPDEYREIVNQKPKKRI